MADPGLQQVVCACLTETFRFVVSPAAVLMVCTGCGAVNGELTRPPGWEPFSRPADADAAYGWDRHLPRVTGPRQPRAHAAWVSDLPPGGIAGERDMLPSFEALPPAPIPRASPEAANAVLDGGPYDGYLLALPPDVTTLNLAGHAYTVTGRGDDKARRVFAWHDPEAEARRVP